MCDSCDEIIQVGSSGFNGYSPIYANIEGTCDGSDVVVQQLVSWTGGTGLRPSYEGNTMTDAWLTANPLYLGDSGWVEVLCDATNILGATGPGGTDGATGETGPQGPAGEDGCDPEITLTVSVDGSEEYPAVVTRVDDPVAPCDPEYSIVFPTTAFTENATLNTNINDLIAAALVAEEFSEDLTTGDVGITNASQVYLVGTTGPASSLELHLDPYLYSSFTQLYKVGKTVTFNFRLGIVNNTGSLVTVSQILLGFPPAFTDRPSNSSQYSAVGIWLQSLNSTNGYNPISTRVPIITTNSVDSDFLAIRYEPVNLITFPILSLSPGNHISLIGQITFNIT